MNYEKMWKEFREKFGEYRHYTNITPGSNDEVRVAKRTVNDVNGFLDEIEKRERERESEGKQLKKQQPSIDPKSK